MLYPHNESQTPNLCEDYKNYLESEAKNNAAKNSEYEKQAIDFLLNTKTYLSVIKTRTIRDEIGNRDVYMIRIGRAYNRDENYELTDQFKGSVNDCQNGKFLTAYDVLAYFSMYCHDSGLYDTDDVYQEYGEMKPSQAQAIFDEYQKTRKVLSYLFSDDQLEQLSEIQ